MGDSIHSLAEVKVGDIHCSPPIYPAADAIIEGNEDGQAQFPLVESMLTTPHNLLVFRLLGDGIQNKLSQHLSRDRGETDWPVVSRILLLALLKTEVTLAILQSSGPSPVLHDLSKMIESGLAVTSASSLGTHGCIPSGPKDLCALIPPRCSWTTPSLSRG